MIIIFSNFPSLINLLHRFDFKSIPLKHYFILIAQRFTHHLPIDFLKQVHFILDLFDNS